MEKPAKSQLQADALRLTIDAMLEVGPEATSVDQIIRQLGIGKSQFYSLFRSKTELLTKSIEQLSLHELGLADIADLETLKRWFLKVQQTPPALLRVLATIGNANSDVKIVATNKIEELSDALLHLLQRLQLNVDVGILTNLLIGVAATRQIDLHAPIMHLDPLLEDGRTSPRPVSLPPHKARPQPRLGSGFCP